MSTYFDLFICLSSTYPRIRIPTFLSRGRIDLRCMWRHLRCMLRQDMATAHDRKVGVLLCAFLGLPRSIDLSSTYSASWISRHRLIFDLFSTQISRRRLIRQLASSCSTSGRQGKSRMSTYSDLLATYVDLFQEVRIPTFLSRGRIDLRCMTRHGHCPR